MMMDFIRLHFRFRFENSLFNFERRLTHIDQSRECDQDFFKCPRNEKLRTSKLSELVKKIFLVHRSWKYRLVTT